MYLFIILLNAALLMQSCYYRIGTVTMISTRNVESKLDYKLIKKYVSAKAKTKNDDVMQVTVDKAVKQCPEGEFLKNATFSVKGNGRKMKVVGDVWGLPTVNKNVEISVNAKVEFKEGDEVAFKTMGNGKIIQGKIIGINANTAIVQYTTEQNGPFKSQTKKIELKYEELTLIRKSEEMNIDTKKEEQPDIKPNLKVGDYVAFKDEITGNYLKGEISTISKNIAFVEYPDPNNPSKTKEVGKDVSLLTKIDKPQKETPLIEKKSIEVGDYVFFKKFEDAPELKGKVIQINSNIATVEYTDTTNSKTKEIELDIAKLTKVDK